MSDSVRPHRQQPTRLPCPWDYPGENTGVGWQFPPPMHESERWKVKSLSPVRLIATPRTAAHQAPPSMGFFQARVLEWGAIAFSGDDITLTAESEEEPKIPLLKVKEENGKAGFKLNIQKTKIMASSPITSWQINGENVQTVADFIFLGLQNHCRWLLQPWN